MDDATKSLTIALEMTKDSARQTVQELRSDLKANHERILDDAEVAELAKTEVIKRENRQRVQAAAQATKTTIELEREAAKERERVAKEAADARIQADKQAAKAAKDAANEATKAAKEAAAAQALANREAARAARQAASEAAKSAKEAAAEQKRAEKDRADSFKQLMAEIAESQKRLNRELTQGTKDWAAEGKKAAADQAENQNQAYKLWLDAHLRRRKGILDEKQAQQEMDAAIKAGLSSAMAFVGLQSGYAAVNKVIGAIAENSNRVADNMMKAAERFTEFRRKTLELQAVEGKEANNESTRKIAEEAAKAGINPEFYVDFKRMMNEEAFGTVGDKFSQAQYDQLVQHGAKFSQARGLKGDDVSKLMGSLMRNAKPGETPDDIVRQFGEIFNTLEVAPGATQLLMPEFVQALATGMNAKDAAKATATAAEKGRPREAGAVADAFQRSIRNLFVRDDGKGAKDFGLNVKDNAFQSLQKIYERAQKEGVDFNNTNEFGVWLGKHGITEQESVSALQTYINKGIIGGGFKRADERMGQDGRKVFDETIGRFNRSDEGKAQAIEAKGQASDITSGEGDAPLKDIYREARTLYQNSGRDKQTTWTDHFRAMLPNSFFGTAEDQLIRQQALQIVHGRAKDAGLHMDAPNAELPMVTGEQANREILRVLKQIEENSRKGPQPLSTGKPTPMQARPGR